MGKKNKRGDRGSTEEQEDKTAAKRPNMADDQDDELRGEEQISLIDMSSMSRMPGTILFIYAAALS